MKNAQPDHWVPDQFRSILSHLLDRGRTQYLRDLHWVTSCICHTLLTVHDMALKRKQHYKIYGHFRVSYTCIMRITVVLGVSFRILKIISCFYSQTSQTGFSGFHLPRTHLAVAFGSKFRPYPLPHATLTIVPKTVLELHLT